MRLSFAGHIIEIQTWETKGDMMNFLANCNAESLVLGEDAEEEVGFYSASIHLNYSAKLYPIWNELIGSRFDVGVCSEGHGLKPHLLMLSEKQLVIFGFNSEVVGISIKNREVSFRTSLDYSLFRSFVHLSQVEIVLAFHEIGVVALTEDGKELWKYSEDVIIDSLIDRDTLQLSFMDSPPVSINVLSGSVITTYDQTIQ